MVVHCAFAVTVTIAVRTAESIFFSSFCLVLVVKKFTPTNIVIYVVRL